MGHITFRPAIQQEMDQFDGVASYVFADNTPAAERRPPTLLPEWSQCAFDGDRIVATSGAYPFRIQVNGVTTSMHGVTAVGTNPAYRRRGFVRRMITDLLHRAHEQGCSGSILLASMGAIYQRFGYGAASTMVGYRFDPRNALLQVERPPVGSVKVDEAANMLDELKSVYKRFSSSRNMLTHRGELTWEIFLRAPGGARTWVAMHYDEAGEPDGYWVYRTAQFTRPDHGPDQEFSVVDHAWLNLDAWHALWEFVRAHDLVGRVSWSGVPEDDPAPGLMLEPRALNLRQYDGLWYRVVNVERALNERGYSGTGEAVVQILEDDLCPWNVGRYLVTASGEAHEIQQTDAAPDITCSVNALASMISGHASATFLDHIGRAEIHVAGRAAVLDQLFAARYRPALSFGF